MKKMFSTALVTVLVACIIFSSCSRDTGLDKSFVFPIDSDPVCLDPQIAQGNAAEIVINNTFEGLVILNENGEITQGVAVNWSISGDGLTYTFELRQNAQWNLKKSHSDILGEDYKDSFNTKVTAHDFVFAFRRTLNPTTKSKNASLLYNVKNAKMVHQGDIEVSALGVKAINDTKLEICLENKSTDFLYTLITPACMPCNEEFFNATKGKYGIDVKYILCNGPFYVSRWAQDSSLFIKRNDSYSGNSVVFPSSVSFMVNENRVAAVENILQGSYSASPVLQEYASTLLKNDKITVTEHKNTVWGFAFNCQSPEFQNMNIRLALCHAIDSSAIDVPETHYKAKGIVPECCTVGDLNFRDTTDNVKFVECNENKAKDFMAKGLEQLEDDSVDAVLLCSPEHEQLMRKLLQKWQEVFGLSMNVSIEVLEISNLKSRVKGLDYELAFYPVTANDSLTANFLKSFTSHNPNNVFGYGSQIYDSLLDKIPTVSNLLQAAQGCAQAEAHLIQNGVMYPVFSQSSYFALAQGVSGIYPHPEGNNVSFIKAMRKD
ncbi:MAG TPA: peptide ABC transporter substrate-binding protein [Clostridia bacterium]|nr:peptide ABC transporter substrate-binding protein [Clostridia bacterium]